LKVNNDFSVAWAEVCTLLSAFAIVVCLLSSFVLKWPVWRHVTAFLVIISHMMAVVGVGFLPPFVCLFTHTVSQTDAARITKLDIQMFHMEPWKPIYFGIGRSRSRSESAVFF